jgi:hypothetical protein
MRMPSRRDARFTVLVILGLIAFTISGTSASHAYAQGYSSVVFSGVVTLDGSPAPDGTEVEVRSAAVNFGGGVTSGGAYQFELAESSLPARGSIVSLDAPGLYATPVDVRVIFGATVTADLEGFSEPPSALPDPGDGEAFISVPRFVNISPQATAVDATGFGVTVIGGTVRISEVGGQVSVPVVMFGGTLEDLDDPVTGLTIRRVGADMVIRMPFRDKDGADTVRVIATTAGLSGAGYSAVGTVKTMSIDLPTRSRDFSEQKPKVGVGSVKLLGDVESFPSNGYIAMSLLYTPDSEADARMRQALLERGEEPSDLGFAVKFDTEVFSDALDFALLQMSLGKAWYDAQEPESVVVVRLADDGTEQVWDFVPQDTEADPVLYELRSPEGLSTFVITAVRKAQEATPSPTPSPTATTKPPTATPTAVTPTPTAAPPVPTSGASVEPTVTPVATPTATAPAVEPTSQPTATPAESGGGSCNAPVDGRASAGQIALLASPLLLLVSRRLSRR